MSSTEELDYISDLIRSAKTRECVDTALSLLPQKFKGREAKRLRDLARQARMRVDTLADGVKPSVRLETVIKGEGGGELEVVFDFNHNGTPVLTVLQVNGSDFPGVKKGPVPLTAMTRSLEPILPIIKNDEAIRPFLVRLAF